MKKNILQLTIPGLLIFGMTINSPAHNPVNPAMPAVQTDHFHPVTAGNGVDHMNINLVSLPANLLEPGDEIGIFDGSICVGAGKVLQENLNRKSLSIPASSGDPFGGQGFTEGNPVIIKLWKSTSGNEQILEPDMIKGSSTFLKHESLFGSLEKYATGIFADELFENGPEVECYPNPFKDEITIQINLQEPSPLTIDIYSRDGREIVQLARNEQVGQGIRIYRWDGKTNGGSTVPEGIYFLRILADRDNINRNILYVKTD